MNSRQIQMIGLASGIGTGLFLSSAYTIHTAGAFYYHAQKLIGTATE
ncbi:hypothetical protein [Leuconostoc carnosum]